jgi:hypothetical protein
MSKPAQKILSSNEFLELLDDDDVALLWRKWQMPASAVINKKAPVFVDAVLARSNTTLLQEVMALSTKTLRMLREVLEFLSNQKSAVRTTGSLLVLKDEFDITPQQVDATLKWSARALRRVSSTTWEELAKRLSTEVKPLLENIADRGAVRYRRKQESFIKTTIRMERGPTRIRSERIASYDRDGFRDREEYGQKIKELNRKLADLPDQVDNVCAQELFAEIDQLSREYERGLRQSREHIRTADRQNNCTSGVDLTDRDHDVWKSFVEDLLFLADVEESASAADVLRMDLFRKRPQLYEVWIVVILLSFMRAIGYELEMLTLLTTHAGRIVWNLNYAKSQIPVARLVRTRDGQECFLFYQLFRPGLDRDEMPDIALMPSTRPEDTPIWIMDPKHSERGAYSLVDYQEVGTRYQTAFAPLRTWIAEYYPRPKLGDNNPLIMGRNVELIRDVSPGGEGYKYLLRELRALHRGVSVQVLVIADVSGSFERHVERLVADLRNLRMQGVILHDDIIWFSDEARRVGGYLAALDQEELRPPTGLGSGTRFRPALELAEALCKDTNGALAVRIYTDGEFTDISSSEAINQLKKYADVEMVDFARIPDASS